MNDTQNQRHEDCLKFYIEQNGRDHARIEFRMRLSGHLTFNRRVLYGRNKNGEYRPGWIGRFGWKAHLPPAPPPEAQTGPRSSASSSPAQPSDVRKGCAFPTGRIGSAGGSASASAAGGTAADHISNPHGKAKPFRTSCGQSPREGFEEWLKQVSPGYTWDWKYQKYIYKHLERVTSGECKRLMIFMPPRHGKSELVTVRYAGWRLWNDPAMRVIISSYNQKLANKFSRSVRRILSQEEDRTMRSAECGVRNEEIDSARQNSRSAVRGSRSNPADDSAVRTPQSAVPRMFPPSGTINTVAEWETAVGGGMKAVGVGAGVTGFGSQLIVIDDPVKNRAEAESETIRDKTWDWYRNDLYTRLEPNGSIILIQTRWHEDDLAGRLLRDSSDGGDTWEIIDLPALAEDGGGDAEMQRRRDAVTQNSSASPRRSLAASKDVLGRSHGVALCPQRFNEEALGNIQRQLGSYAFSALYQQRPTPAEGGIFKRTWFKRFVDRAPQGLTWKRGYDLAVSTKTSSCYTASFRVAYDDEGCLYIADGFRKRIEYPEQRRYLISRLAHEADTEHGVEKALHGEAIIQDLRQEPAVRGSNLRGIDVTADKVTRALKWAPLAEEGKVILVRGAWNTEFLDEVCKFPGGQFNDQVDAVSLAVSMFQKKGRKAYSF